MTDPHLGAGNFPWRLQNTSTTGEESRGFGGTAGDRGGMAKGNPMKRLE